MRMKFLQASAWRLPQCDGPRFTGSHSQTPGDTWKTHSWGAPGIPSVCVHAQLRLTLSPWTVAHQAPLSVGFFRQAYWSGLPFPPPGDLPDTGIEPTSPAAPTLAGRFFSTEPQELPTCLMGLLFTSVLRCRKGSSSKFWTLETPIVGIFFQ